MRLLTKFDTGRLENAIRIADKKMGVRPAELVKAAALFFTQSFAKAMMKSKKNRKVYQFQDTSTKTKDGFRTTFAIYRRGKDSPTKFYRRRRADLRDLRTITYQGLGRQVIVEAGRMAGLSVANPTGIGTDAKRHAANFARCKFRIDGAKPFIQFSYSARDVAGYPGRKAARIALPKTTRRLLGFAKSVAKEQVEAFRK